MGFDIFFWVFNDASSFVATHWHTAIEIMYIIDGEVDVMMNQQTVILNPEMFFWSIQGFLTPQNQFTEIMQY